MKIIKIERNEENLLYPYVTFQNKKIINIKVGVLTSLYKIVTDKFIYELREIAPLKFTKKDLIEAYKKGYAKESEYIDLLLKNDKSNYKHLSYFAKGLYSELKEIGVLK